MNRTIRCLMTLAAGAALALPSLAGAMDHAAMGHGNNAQAAAAKSTMKGAEIRATKVDGYQLKYYLIDMAAMMKGMPMAGMDMSQMKSHHLMVFVQGPDGKAVTEAKVGFLTTAPDKGEQKAMAMAMEGGFGADVDLKGKGSHKIKAKAVIGDKTLVDDFSYAVK